MNPNSDAWTIGRVLTWSTDFLVGRGVGASPRLDAELLLAHALGLSRIQIYTHFDKPLTAVEREPFRGLLKRRGAGEPVAYITGEKEFMGLAFKVGPEVLIPRPDTEVLVEQLLGVQRAEVTKILDVGTGSGCIAISAARKINGACVTAWDVDDRALALARSNAERHGVPIDFQNRDALAESSWDGDSFDVIVSNPPYIAPDERPGLPKSVAGFEPAGALFAEPDGLTFYRALARLAPKRLTAGGRLLVEIGSTQAAAVTTLFTDAGWTAVRTVKDYGKLDRVVLATRPADV